MSLREVSIGMLDLLYSLNWIALNLVLVEAARAEDRNPALALSSLMGELQSFFIDLRDPWLSFFFFAPRRVQPAIRVSLQISSFRVCMGS